MKRNYKGVGMALIISGLFFAFFFTGEFIFNSNKFTWGPIDSAIWGQYGDIIGGFVGTIVALVGVLLLFETLNEQRQTYIRQQVETRFFELLKLHRENIIEMESKGKTGRSVFIDIKDEFHDLFELVIAWYTLEKSEVNKALWNKNAVQIAYLINFFGVDNSSTEYLRGRIREIIANDKVYSEFDQFCLSPLIDTHERAKEDNKQKPISQRTYLEYDGHQSRLGHYYRHLFQTVRYINAQPAELFTYKEKYDYIKTLRAQLGTHEQALLLYNSISPLGEPWELSSDIREENDKLITKYNLLKNIPKGFTKEIDPKAYYPDIFYEIDKEPTAKRAILEEIYNRQATVSEGKISGKKFKWDISLMLSYKSKR